VQVDYTALDDKALIRLIIGGREGALSELYDRYHRLVFSLALNIVHDPATAEEIVLDVFTRIWEKADTYRSEHALVSTWLTSITRYRAIDLLRRQRARPEKESTRWADLPLSAHPQVDGPEPAVERALQRQRMRAALNDLPVEQRQVLALAYFQGLTQSEIAETTDQPLGTVKTRVRLAMLKLRKALQDLAPD
jgi:RNA polymerase sigma-70 factor, ECF subfamily